MWWGGASRRKSSVEEGAATQYTCCAAAQELRATRAAHAAQELLRTRAVSGRRHKSSQDCCRKPLGGVRVHAASATPEWRRSSSTRRASRSAARAEPLQLTAPPQAGVQSYSPTPGLLRCYGGDGEVHVVQVAATVAFAIAAARSVRQRVRPQLRSRSNMVSCSCGWRAVYKQKLFATRRGLGVQ